MELTSNSKTIFSRLYLSLSVFTFIIVNLISGNLLYGNTESYINEKKVYLKIQSQHEKRKDQCKDCLNKYITMTARNPPICKKFCSWEVVYDKETGEGATSNTSKFDQVTYSELEKPKFEYESSLVFISTMTLLPLFFIYFKKWIFWVLNLTKKN